MPVNGHYFNPTADARILRRNFDPDLLMELMMFGHSNVGNNKQKPSVFGSNWGFSIHYPKSYSQYVLKSSKHNEKGEENTVSKIGKSNVIGAIKSESIMEQSSKGKASPKIASFNEYRFDPNNLFQTLMKMSSGANSYNKLQDNLQTNNLFTGPENATFGTKSDNNTETTSNRLMTSPGNKTYSSNNYNANIGEATRNTSTKSTNRGFEFNANKLNKHTMQLGNNVVGGLPKQTDHAPGSQQTGSRHGTFDFNPTELNSNMFNNVGYNPVYVQSDFKNRQTRKTNKILPKSVITNVPIEKRFSGSTEFDPNGQNIFSSVQTHWGFSLYNPQKALGQYSGSNSGVESKRLNVDLSTFNPNTLNDYLMFILRNKMTTLSESNVGTSFYRGMEYNPIVVNAQAILPMFHQHIPEPVMSVNFKNKTHRTNEYVKNPHSNVSQSYSAYNTMQNTNNGYVAVHLKNGGGKSQNNTAQTISTGNGNNMVVAGGHSNGTGTVHGNPGTQSGATNTIAKEVGSVHTIDNGYAKVIHQQGPAHGVFNDTSVLFGNGGSLTQMQAGELGFTTTHQAGGPDSLGNGLSSHGNGNQVGISNTGKHSGSTGGVSVTNTGGAAWNVVTQTNTGGHRPNTFAQTGTGGLGSNTVSQIGSGNLGSNTVSQIGSGGLGSNTVFQTSNGGMGSNTISQTGSGGLGSNTVSQTGSGGLGSKMISQTGTGILGLNTVSQSGTGSQGNVLSQTAAGSLGSASVNQIGASSNSKHLNSVLVYNSVSQTSTGSLGSNSVSQTGAGSLGLKNVTQTSINSVEPISVLQTAAGSLGSNSVSQTSAGGLGSSSVSNVGSAVSNSVSQSGTSGLASISQIDSGSVASNTVYQTASGSLGSNSIGQSSAGTLGSTSVQQTYAGSLGSNSISQTSAGSLRYSKGRNNTRFTGAGTSDNTESSS